MVVPKRSVPRTPQRDAGAVKAVRFGERGGGPVEDPDTLRDLLYAVVTAQR
jgi:hypothetical protein